MKVGMEEGVGMEKGVRPLFRLGRDLLTRGQKPSRRLRGCQEDIGR
jgi:hypothetical protein